MKKRVLSLLLVVLMVVSLLPMTAFADGGFFTITNGTPEIAKETNHGYITIDKETAEEGDTVTVEAYPAEGYQLKSLTVTPVAPTISTIADVLATVEGFPEDTSGGTSPVAPSSPWINEKGVVAFKYSSALILMKDGYTYGQLSTKVKKEENCYTATISYGSLTFNMENGILTSFEFTADPSKPNAANYVGTYAPASTPSPSLKPITPAKQQDGTYQFTMPAANVAVTAEFEEIPVTIADILPSNFPASNEDNSWCNSGNENVYIYKTDSGLVFYNNTEDCYSVPLSTPLTKEESPGVSYVYSVDGTEIQFNMTGDNDDELENIVVNNCTIPPCIGTYNPIEIVTYDVTYNANGATSGSAPANQTKTASVNLTLATNTGNLAKAGYTFAGWNTKADGSGTHYDTGATYTTDAALTLYAEWIEAPATKTIADILPDDFPTSYETAWITEQGFYTCRLDSSNLSFDIDGSGYIAATTAPVTPSGDDYVYTDEDGSVTFNMENGKLTSITVMVNGDGNTYVYALRFVVTVIDSNYVKEYLVDKGTAYSVNGATLTVGTEADTATPIEGKEFDCWKIGETPVTEDGTITEKTTFVATYKAVHTHTFTYTANNGKITATCTAGCDKGYDTTPLTLTLTAPASLVYDGNVKAFTFADGEADAWTDAGLELPTIFYNIKQSGQSTYLPLFGTLKDVGNYMAQITVGEKTAQVYFSIEAPHTHTFTYTANNGKITATCTQGCDKGYDTTPLTLTLTAPASLVYDGNAKAFTFADGEADAWTGAGLELPTITYVAKSGSSLTSDKAVDAGSYTVSVTVDTDKTASLDFEITKATPYIISDILATVEDFPTTAENGWVNENGLKMYSDTNSANLTMFAPGMWNLVVPHTAEVAPSGDNYVYDCPGETPYTVTFVMENDVLVKVIVSGSPAAIHDGTYAPETYTVTFNMNGHGTQVDPQTVEAGNKATKPATDPVADGWTFGGWYADATFSVTFNFDTAINANTTIYAKWTENTDPQPHAYTIVAGANSEWTEGGTAGLLITSDAPFAKFSSVKIDGSTIAASNYIAEEGSTKITLAPAYLETLSVGTHSIEIVSNDGSASTNFTIKATVPPVSYTVTFNMNGHGTQITAQTVESGSKAIKPADPKASGYTFGGWYADATFSAKFDFNTAITANTTVYAKWTKNSVAPTDPTSPQTGDTSNMFLWIALLLVSGGALVGTTVYGKKRKRAE